MKSVEKIHPNFVTAIDSSIKSSIPEDAKVKKTSGQPVRSKYLVVYDPQNHQALICAAILKTELKADLVEFDRLIDLGYENYIWLGCDKQILPMSSQVLLSKRSIHHVTIKTHLEDEIQLKKKAPGFSFANVRDKLLLKVSASAAERFSRMRKIVERLRGTVEEDRLDGFVQFTKVPGLDSSVTMVDRMLVDMELTGRPSAAKYRAMSARIADFDKKPPYWEINFRDHVSMNPEYRGYRDAENQSNIAKMAIYNSNVCFTHLMIVAAQQVIQEKDVSFCPNARYDEKLVQEYYEQHIDVVRRRLHNSWRWENIEKESGNYSCVMRLSTSKEDMPYVKRILMLSGRSYMNVVNGVNGMIVSSNFKINPKSEINNEVTFN